MNNLLPLLLILAAICLFSNGRNVRHETSAGSAAKSNRKVCILLCLTFDFVNTLQPQVKNAPSISHYWLGLGRFLYGNSSDNEPSSTIAKVAEHGRKLQPIDSVPPTIAVTSMYALPNYKGTYINLYAQFGNSFASFFLSILSSPSTTSAVPSFIPLAPTASPSVYPFAAPTNAPESNQQLCTCACSCVIIPCDGDGFVLEGHKNLLPSPQEQAVQYTVCRIACPPIPYQCVISTCRRRCQVG